MKGDFWATMNIPEVLCLIFVLLMGYTIYRVLSSPFRYPYFVKNFDVSGKRNPELDDFIETFINKGGFSEIARHHKQIQKWKKDCEERILSSRIPNLRRRQYMRCLDDKNAYRFNLIRAQTRYRQRNYRKYAYKVNQVVREGRYSYESLCDKYQELNAIGFETTLRNYHSKEQRRLMTKQLREQIAKRDNYTCQNINCRKYMPDGVGLHIDHIVPISKGGKTVPSNLQVLCSKCNGKKAARAEA